MGAFDFNCVVKVLDRLDNGGDFALFAITGIWLDDDADVVVDNGFLSIDDDLDLDLDVVTELATVSVLDGGLLLTSTLVWRAGSPETDTGLDFPFDTFLGCCLRPNGFSASSKEPYRGPNCRIICFFKPGSSRLKILPI